MNDKQIEDLVDLMFDTNMEEVMKEKSTLEYIHKLQQENKQLKEKIDILLEDNNQLEEIRIKAIEYIKETGLYCDYGDLCNQSAKDLLEILGDKE